MECIWINTGNEISRQHFQDKKILARCRKRKCKLNCTHFKCVSFFSFVSMFYVPQKKLSVMSGRLPVFLGWTSTKQRIKYHAQGHNKVPPKSLDLVSFQSQFYHSTTKLFINLLYQGSYWQVGVKFKNFSRTYKRLSYCFRGLKLYEKYWLKLWCLYLVQHMLHQIKAPQFYCDLGLRRQC